MYYRTARIKSSLRTAPLVDENSKHVRITTEPRIRFYEPEDADEAEIETETATVRCAAEDASTNTAPSAPSVAKTPVHTQCACCDNVSVLVDLADLSKNVFASSQNRNDPIRSSGSTAVTIHHMSATLSTLIYKGKDMTWARPS